MTRPVDADFPVVTWPAGCALWRIHRAACDPVWFSDDGTGRFDPVGSGFGACYAAAEPLGAFVEVFRTRLELDAADIDDRRLSELTCTRDLRVANLGSRAALRYGATAQLGADGDYSAAQALAAGLCAEGFDGVRWWVRHDPAQELTGIAVFDRADVQLSAGTAAGIDDGLLSEARRAFGYRAVPRP